MTNIIQELTILNLLDIKIGHNNEKIYELKGNANINISDFYIFKEHEKFLGNGYQISYTCMNNINVFGLFSSNINNDDCFPLVKDLNVNVSCIGNNYYTGGGIFSSFSNGFKVYDCLVFTKLIPEIEPEPELDYIARYSGGICGSHCNNFKIKNSNVNSDLIEHHGGFCGAFINNNDISKSCIDNCKLYCENNYGGLIGSFLNYGDRTSIKIKNCKSYNTNIYNGGIIGSFSNIGKFSTIKIENSKSYGNINIGAGGICGYFCGIGDNSETNIENSISHGNIEIFAGGIVGMCFGNTINKDMINIPEIITLDDYENLDIYYNGNTEIENITYFNFINTEKTYELNINSKIYIHDCKTYGQINGGGGICGSFGCVGGCYTKIDDCVSKGDINTFLNINNNIIPTIYYGKNIGSGGIISSFIFFNVFNTQNGNGKIKINKCKAYGKLYQYSGGISGSYTCILINTYPYRSIIKIKDSQQLNKYVEDNTGGVTGSESGSNTNSSIIYVKDTTYKKNAFTIDTISYNIQTY